MWHRVKNSRQVLARVSLGAYGPFRMATRPEVLEAVAQAREARLRVRPVLRRLMRHFELTDRALADAFGISRQAMNYRINGRTTIPPEEVAGFAAFFGVPEQVMYLTPDEALRWVLDHPDEVRSSIAATVSHAIGG